MLMALIKKGDDEKVEKKKPHQETSIMHNHAQTIIMGKDIINPEFFILQPGECYRCFWVVAASH